MGATKHLHWFRGEYAGDLSHPSVMAPVVVYSTRRRFGFMVVCCSTTLPPRSTLKMCSPKLGIRYRTRPKVAGGRRK